MIKLTNKVLLCLIIINILIIIIHLCYPICAEKIEKLKSNKTSSTQSNINKIFENIDPLDEKLHSLNALSDTPEVHNILNETFNKKELKAKDNYRIANIYRHYVQNDDLAKQYYAEALDNMAQNPQDGDDYMLDQIEGFGMDIGDIRQLVAEDRIVRQTLEHGNEIEVQPFNINDMAPQPVLREPLNQVDLNGLNNSPKLTQNKLEQLKHMNKKEKKTYMKNLIKHTSDSQNVHDPHVTDDIATFYNKIRDSPSTNKDIKTMIEQYRNRVGDKAYYNALTTLSNMKKNEKFSKANAGEQDILNAVWRRINAPINSNKVDQLNLSLVESLANCITPTGSVCISGRVANVIGSLGNIDDDVGILKTKEMVRNEVFATAGHEMKSVLEEYKGTPGAEDFNNGNDTVDSQRIEQLIKQRIEMRLRKDYKGVIPEKDLELLIVESSAVF